jgi:uncharacterized membrane protein YfcA
VTPLDIIELVGVGLGAGFLAGLLGVGGGILMVPAMVLLMNFDQHVAQGTSLLVIIPAALTGSITHYRNGRLRVRDAAFIAAGGVFGAALGSVLALSTDDTLLRQLFAGLLLVTGLRILVTGIERRRRGAPTPVSAAVPMARATSSEVEAGTDVPATVHSSPLGQERHP